MTHGNDASLETSHNDGDVTRVLVYCCNNQTVDCAMKKKVWLSGLRMEHCSVFAVTRSSHTVCVTQEACESEELSAQGMLGVKYRPVLRQ